KRSRPRNRSSAAAELSNGVDGGTFASNLSLASSQKRRVPSTRNLWHDRVVLFNCQLVGGVHEANLSLLAFWLIRFCSPAGPIRGTRLEFEGLGNVVDTATSAAVTVRTGASLRQGSNEKNSRRPQPDEMRSIFARLGLGG